jgi:cellulose biosynthesis protein BcsQ
MKTLAFLSQKGGSGKTTLAVHTAVAAHEAGEQVVIIDTDPQQSATVWSEARQADTPVVVTVAVAELVRVLNAARGDGMTLAIIDTAPHAAPDAARIAQVADLIVVPVRPTAFDLAAAQGAVAIIKAAKAHAVLGSAHDLSKIARQTEMSGLSVVCATFVCGRNRRTRQNQATFFQSAALKCIRRAAEFRTGR